MLKAYEEIFNTIYDETFDDVRKYVAVKCSDPVYISDILQETYLDFYRLIQRKGPDYASDYRALLYKIAKRKVYRYYSFKEKMKAILPLQQVNSDGNECLLDLPDEKHFEDEVLSGIESERIWNIISEYPVETRKILYLFFYEEMSHSQIAKELNCNLSYVKNKLYRTLGEIREKGENYDKQNKGSV